MVNAILWGNGINGEMKEVLDLGMQLVYWEDGLLGGHRRSNGVTFTPYFRLRNGITVAYLGEKPSAKEILKKIEEAIDKQPWKFM